MSSELFVGGVILFIATLVLVIWQPRGLSIGWSAGIGAMFALSIGVVSWQDVAVVGSMVWNATLAVIATVILSMILDALGFFQWAALHMARLARGNGRYMFLSMLVLGALVAMIFNNDGAALMVTPIVLAMVRALRMSEKTVLAYVLASGFIADTTSIPLVISNLVNMIASDTFGIGFGEYVVRMLVPNGVAFFASVAMLWIVFRKDLPRRYDPSLLARPDTVISDHKLFRFAWIVLGLLLIGYWVSESLRLPVSVIAWVAAGAMMIAARRSSVIQTRQVLRQAPWGVIVFSLGMYVIVYGLRNTGWVDWIAGGMEWAAQFGTTMAIFLMGIFAAVLASFMNNLPTVMLNGLAIQEATMDPVIREAMIYANVIGCDLGPKMTPIGSLATLIWLHVLAQKKMRIGWGLFCRIGVVLTAPVLLATLAGWSIWYSILQQ
jgi:arsenical pump membrane protein